MKVYLLVSEDDYNTEYRVFLDPKKAREIFISKVEEMGFTTEITSEESGELYFDCEWGHYSLTPVTVEDIDEDLES